VHPVPQKAELVASGDGKAVGLRSGGGGLYWLCAVFDLCTHFVSRAGAKSSAVYRSDAYESDISSLFT
jgi:hypothetical protein